MGPGPAGGRGRGLTVEDVPPAEPVYALSGVVRMSNDLLADNLLTRRYLDRIFHPTRWDRVRSWFGRFPWRVRVLRRTQVVLDREEYDALTDDEDAA